VTNNLKTKQLEVFMNILKLIKGRYIALTIVLTLLFSCKPKNPNGIEYDCSGKVNNNVKYISFGYKYYTIGDKIKIDIENGDFKFESELFNKDYYYENGIEYIVRNYCSDKDSIKVQLWYNNKDTTFYINMKEYEECLVGTGKKVHVRLYHRNHKLNRFGGG